MCRGCHPGTLPGTCGSEPDSLCASSHSLHSCASVLQRQLVPFLSDAKFRQVLANPGFEEAVGEKVTAGWAAVQMKQMVRCCADLTGLE